MSDRSHKGLVSAEAVLLLLPLTLFTFAFAVANYCAYPIPNWRPLQIAFDTGMLVQVAALIAAWRLSAAFLKRGRNTLHRMHATWLWILVGGALLGLAGAAMAAWHMLNPDTAPDVVGFALFAPAVILLPSAIHFLRLRHS